MVHRMGVAGDVDHKMAIVEDYNYRSLNRNDLMSLSSINEADMKIKKFKQLDLKRYWSINL